MAKQSTFIKLDRNIQKWRWYTNGNTFRVFLHILMNANIESNDFENAKIKRGELATSYDSMANTLKLTNQQVRTAISHLKSTGEITVKRYSKFQVITITNYSQYQDKLTDKSTINQQSLNNQSTINQQQLKNNKNIKNEKNNTPDGEFCPSGIAPNGIEYVEVGGKWYDKDGTELNSQGYPVMKFDVEKRDF